MPIEELVKRIEAQKKVILGVLFETDKLLDELSKTKNINDWITVKKASKILDVSVSYIYQKIKDGTLNIGKIDSKIYVKRSELIKLFRESEKKGVEKGTNLN